MILYIKTVPGNLQNVDLRLPGTPQVPSCKIARRRNHRTLCIDHCGNLRAGAKLDSLLKINPHQAVSRDLGRRRIGLNWKCGIGMNAAREKVRVADALGHLPKISAAFRNGEISYSKVRAMTRVAEEESEDYLLMIAQHGTAQHVETVIRDFRRAERLVAPADSQHESREFNFRWDDDGSLVFNGRLPAEVGAMLMKAMQASIDQEEKDVTAETRQPVSARRTSRYRGNFDADLRRLLEDRFIDSETCVTGWTGERMDGDLAVSMLWDLNHRPDNPRAVGITR